MKLYYKDDWVKLIQGDCLEVMDKMIEKGIKFNCILTDPPYGTTNRNKWDIIIPFDKMWDRINKLTNKNTPILLFADEPFTSELICSNKKLFKQRITWDKDKGSGFLNAKKMLLKQTEDIVLFYDKPPTYNPQMTDAKPENIRPLSKEGYTSLNYGGHTTKPSDDYDTTKRYPTNLINIKSTTGECNNVNRLHPTQKPIELMEWLIKTYTNENDTILDFTSGSGSTLVSAKKLHRKCIGIELEEKYCEITKNRLLDIADKAN